MMLQSEPASLNLPVYVTESAKKSRVEGLEAIGSVPSTDTALFCVGSLTTAHFSASLCRKWKEEEAFRGVRV